ncbi:MAG: thioredoxin-dependent thiol peroxidase [Cryobacterium sp.]
MTKLQQGDAAPAFSLSDAHGSVVSLAGLRGSKLVVYFYPAAFTGGCTTEACDFRDNLASLQASGYSVIGISPDSVERLAEFAEAESLSYPLLSDADHSTAEAWGAWGEKVVNGEQRIGLLRSTFVLDEQGAVAAAHYNVDAVGHVASLRSELGL